MRRKWIAAMLVGVQRRTVILLCLAVALIGAGTYALTRGSSPAAPAKARASSTLPAHMAALVPEVRPRLYPAPEHETPKRADAHHRTHKRHARSTKHRSRKHAESVASLLAGRDPDLGEFSGGQAAPVASRPVPNASPVPAVVAIPTVPASAVTTTPAPTVGAVLGLIGAVTGETPAAPPGASPQTPVDCTASNSGPGSAGSGDSTGKSGSGKSGDAQTAPVDLVTQIVDLLCAARTDDKSGPGNGN